MLLSLFVVGASAQNWGVYRPAVLPAVYRPAVFPAANRLRAAYADIDWDCDKYSWVPSCKQAAKQAAEATQKIGADAGFTVEVQSASEVNVEEHNCLSREVWSTEKKVWCCKEKGINCPLPVTTTTSPVPALVGSNPCTYGPSYWCASEANAQECQFDFGLCENGGLKIDDAEFNCKSREVWTNEKAQWCCKNENTGCFYATLEREEKEVQDSNAGADGSCANGILSDDGAVCCASACGTCGGKGCAKRPGGRSSCCKQIILNQDMLCARKQAPCVMKGAGYSDEDEVKRGSRN